MNCEINLFVISALSRPKCEKFAPYYWLQFAAILFCFFLFVVCVSCQEAVVFSDRLAIVEMSDCWLAGVRPPPL